MIRTQKKLREAYFFLNHLARETSVGSMDKDASEFYFSAFLSAARSVTFVLESEEPIFREWFPTWRAFLTNTERHLLGRFTGARNRALKRETPTVTEDRIARASAGLSPELLFFFEGLAEDGVEMSPRRVLKGRLAPKDAEEELIPTCQKYVDLLAQLVTAFSERAVTARCAPGSTQEDETRTAYHEAGHAVLQFALIIGCERVTIEPNATEGNLGASTHGGEFGKPGLGSCDQDDDVANLKLTAEDAFWIRHAVALYAGAQAVKRWNPARSDWLDGANHDYRGAHDAICKIAGDDEQCSMHLNRYSERRAQILIEHYWPEVESIARALVERRTLIDSDVREIILNSLNGRQGYLLQF